MLVTCSWIFNVFDEDGGGTIDKEEVTSIVTNDYSISILCMWQVSKLVGSLLKLTGGQQQQQQEGDEASLQSCVQVSPSSRGGQEVTMCVQAILEAMDEDGNGTISKEEFVNNALKIEFIRNILMAQESSAAGE